MFVVRRIFLYVLDLLVDVPFHPAAEGRVELSKIANLHGKVVIPSEAEESREVTVSTCYGMLRLSSA